MKEETEKNIKLIDVDIYTLKISLDNHLIRAGMYLAIGFTLLVANQTVSNIRLQFILYISMIVFFLFSLNRFRLYINVKEDMFDKLKEKKEIINQG